MKTRVATDDERLQRAVPGRRRPRSRLPGRRRRAHDVDAARRRRDRRQPLAHPAVPEVRRRRQPQLGQGRHQGPRRRPRRARRGRPPRRADHATRCARRCWPRSAPAGPRAPTSTSASPRRRSAGRRTPSTARSSRCSPPATSAPPRTARTSPARRSSRRPRSARSRSTRRTSRRRSASASPCEGSLTAAGIPYETGQEGAQIPALLQRLKDLAARAGGPPPLPEPPDTDHLDALLALGGNQRFRAVADDHDRLEQDLERWRAADQQREKRETEWRDLQRLLRHADGLPVAAARRSRRSPPSATVASSSTTPIRSHRCSTELDRRPARRGQAARRAARRRPARRCRRARGMGRVEQARRRPTATPSSPRRKLVAADPPDVSHRRQAARGARRHPAQRVARPDQPRRRAAATRRASAPPSSSSRRASTVTLPSATIKTDDDLDAYLDELRARVQPHLDADKTVII